MQYRNLTPTGISVRPRVLGALMSVATGTGSPGRDDAIRIIQSEAKSWV
jgi:hypothetical protein